MKKLSQFLVALSSVPTHRNPGMQTGRVRQDMVIERVEFALGFVDGAPGLMTVCFDGKPGFSISFFASLKESNSVHISPKKQQLRVTGDMYPRIVAEVMLRAMFFPRAFRVSHPDFAGAATISFTPDEIGVEYDFAFRFRR